MNYKEALEVVLNPHVNVSVAATEETEKEQYWKKLNPAKERIIDALNKQIPKKPIHIHEEHSEHLWKRDKNGEIDTSAWGAGYCNGPVCTRCWHSECIYCNEEWETDPTEPCVIDKDICPVCGSVLSKPKYCHECGQALDWSETL